MTILLISIIVLFCLIGALAALLFIDTEKPWRNRGGDPETRISRHRLYSHVEQGPDSLSPSKTGRDGKP